METLPRHIAVIMDGNGRWASERGLSRSEGHRAGAHAVRTLVEECRTLGIPYVTVYAFSKENWQRPEKEVSGLFDLFRSFLESELPELDRQGIRLRFIGDRGDIPAINRRAFEYAERKTARNAAMTLSIAVSYSGREEILAAVRGALAAGMKPEDVTAESFAGLLYEPDVPDPDLIIRTGGELRISNFLLWQCAYSEFWFTGVYWPDFGKAELHEALESYRTRSRRYGKSEAES